MFVQTHRNAQDGNAQEKERVLLSVNHASISLVSKEKKIGENEEAGEGRERKTETEIETHCTLGPGGKYSTN